MKDTYLIYIPYFNQGETINWIQKFVDTYNMNFGNALLYDPRDVSYPGLKVSFFKILTFRLSILETIPRFTPFFSHTHKINMFVYIFILFIYFRYTFRNKKIIVIMGYYDEYLNMILKALQPHAVVTDICDHWDIKKIQECSSLSKIAITNSKPLTEFAKKYFQTKQISAGYFSKKQVKSQRENFTYKPKTVVFIGTIDWRTNLPLLMNLMDKMKDFTFVFYYKEQFHNLKVLSKYNNEYVPFHEMNIKREQSWFKIKNKNNFCGEVVNSQDELSQIPLKGSVGLILYTDGYKFNKYCHPIKFYNYISMGIPIVSTRVESIKNKYKHSYFASTVEEFEKKIRAADLKGRVKEDFSEIVFEQTLEKKSLDIYEIVSKL